MSTVVVRVDGADITDDIIIATAEFTTQASGSPGLCRFKVKDDSMAYSWTIGKEITLDIDGRRMWGGYLMNVSRQYFFPAEQVRKQKDPCAPTEFTTRGWFLEGADYNILFRKRVIFNKAQPTDLLLKVWPAGTADDVVIRYMCANHLDLSGDGIDYVTLVENVGSPSPDKKASPYGASYTWANAMDAIAGVTGALYYINPDKQLVYTDVDVPNASHNLSDTPAPSEVGYREMEILHDGTKLVNDALVWGAGQGSTSVKFARTQDSASLSAHNRWQKGEFRTDLWRQASVDKRSRSWVYGSPQNKRGGKDDAVSVQCTVKVPYFRVGEKPIFNSDIFGFSDVIPIRRERITFVSPTDPLYELTLSHFIDEPWDTHEFWFPKWAFPQFPPFPPYVPTEPKYPICPMPPASPDLTLVFSDRFDSRPSGQPGIEFGGVYYLPVSPNPWPISGGLGTPTSRDIVLNYMIGTPMCVLVGADGTGVALPGFTVENMTYNATAERLRVQARYSYYQHSMTADPKHPELVAPAMGFVTVDETVPRSRFQGRIWIRYMEDPALGYAVKIWPQSQVEPTAWDILIPTETVPPDVVTTTTNQAERQIDFVDRGKISIQSFIPMESIEIWAGDGSTAPGGGCISLALNQDSSPTNWTVEAGEMAPNQVPGYYVPPLAADYTTITSETATSAYPTEFTPYQNSIQYNQFFPETGSGYFPFVKERIPSGIWMRAYSPFIGGPRSPEGPVAAIITGEFSFEPGDVGISGGNPGPNFDREVPIQFVQYQMGLTEPGWSKWAFEPATVIDERMSSPGLVGGAQVWVPFAVGTDVFPLIANNTPRLQFGIRYRPDDVKQLAGTQWFGPFLLTNARDYFARLRALRVRTVWTIHQAGQRICNPPSAFTANKVCTMATLGSQVTSSPNVWALGTYYTGSLTVDIDGLMLRPGIDFVETEPQTAGQVTVYANLADATTIRFCFLPSALPVVSPVKLSTSSGH